MENTQHEYFKRRKVKNFEPRKRKRYRKKKKKKKKKLLATKETKPNFQAVGGRAIFHATEREKERERCRISESSSLSQHLAAAYLLSAPTWSIHPFLDHRGFSLSLWQRSKSRWMKLPFDLDKRVLITPWHRCRSRPIFWQRANQFTVNCGWQ